MNKENDRYCVLFAKNLLLPGSYALPVYSSHDARFVYEQVKEAAGPGVKVRFYDISESDDPVFIPDEYSEQIKNNIILLIYERFPVRIFSDVFPFICFHDVSLFIRKTANLVEYACQKKCEHGEYIEMYAKNATKSMIAASILNDGAVAKNVERYVNVNNDEIIQADRLRAVTDMVPNVSKEDANRYLLIPNDLYELAEKSYIRTRNLSNKSHEKPEKIDREMDFKEYLVATHDFLPGCCAISYSKEEHDDIFGLIDQYNVNRVNVSLPNVRGINDIMHFGIATFEENPEEFARIAGLMRQCGKTDICSTHDYMVQQASNMEKIKFISMCMLDEHYLIDPRDYISPVYQIEMIQAMAYCRLSYSYIGRDYKTSKKGVPGIAIGDSMNNYLTAIIVGYITQEIRNRIELQCKNVGNDE